MADDAEFFRIALLVGGLLAIGIAIAWGMIWQGRNERQEKLLAVARGLGIDPPSGGERISGEVRGAHVVISHTGPKEGMVQASGIDSRISLTPARAFSNLRGQIAGLRGEDGEHFDLTTGDPEFDARVIARGPEYLLRALLTSDVRRLVLQALEDGASIADGAATIADARFDSTARFIGRAERVGAVVAALRAAPIHENAGLARQALHDPLPDVRLRCLRAFLTMGMPESAMLPTLRAASEDEDWRVSILAAEHLGKEGQPMLAKMLEDDTAPDPPRLLALEALLRSATPGVYLPVMRARLADISHDVRKRAQQVVGAAKDLESIPMLLDRVEQADDWEKASLAEAFGSMGDPAGLPPVRRLLANATAGPIAAKALGEIGELEDVERLRDWMSAPDRGRSEARDAQQSIARIQARHGGDTGGLAIHDAAKDAGAVSIPDAEVGALSSPPPRKQPT